MMRRALPIAVALALVSACGSSPTGPSGPPWSVSGNGDSVFSMPDVDTVRITGSFTGSSSNFIVWVGDANAACGVQIHSSCRLLVNELIGTLWGPTSYSGTVQTGGGGTVTIKNSSGVAWTFTEVR